MTISNWHPPLVWPSQRLTDFEQARAEENTGLAYMIALQSQYGFGLEVDERISIALMSLCLASRGYDPNHGAAFSTYACWTIRKNLLTAGLRTYAHTMRSDPEHNRSGLRNQCQDREIRSCVSSRDLVDETE